MPFDAEPSVEVTARDRMIRLRDFLAKLPPENFDMAVVGSDRCDTPACISGWAQRLFPQRELVGMREMLGLSERQTDALFCPAGWASAKPNDPRFPVAGAVKVLDHYLATGKIKWSVGRR
jgi:hypothetical protein